LFEFHLENGVARVDLIFWSFVFRLETLPPFGRTSW
jgi:hypothetical protein